MRLIKLLCVAFCLPQEQNLINILFWRPPLAHSCPSPLSPTSFLQAASLQNRTHPHQTRTLKSCVDGMGVCSAFCKKIPYLFLETRPSLHTEYDYWKAHHRLRPSCSCKCALLFHAQRCNQESSRNAFLCTRRRQTYPS